MRSMRSLYLLLVLLCLMLLAGCAETETPPEVKRLEGGIFGTTWVVSVADPITDEELIALRQGIEETLERVDWQMSTWKPESELMQLNDHPVGEWMAVSAELMQVLSLSQTISAQSDGAFDVTVGNLVNLWSFGPQQRPDAIPDPGQLQASLETAGYQGLQLDAAAGQARRQQDFFIDLSGVAKGFGVDEVARYLTAQGLSHFLVNIGGEMVASGEREPGQSWRIGIELPHSGVQVAHHIIPVKDMSVATSGDYRNYFEVDGQRFSHTINPLTGWPIDHRVASVTVLTPENANADAWATAMMVLGTDGLPLAESLGLRVLMLERNAGDWTTHLSSAMVAYLGEEKAQALMQGK
ncbi:FAD:protein FMN transferase [Nitrincola sp. A-D6]|uniref:FAD:protein FMN transferase n=1 Tax=Nitrincola sp. A-D6 TaxID=1545442 RepID=UPI00068A4D1F|nr:FAD:protein FMN transferase [Nitrincola sp. A-D6]